MFVRRKTFDALQERVEKLEMELGYAKAEQQDNTHFTVCEPNPHSVSYWFYGHRSKHDISVKQVVMELMDRAGIEFEYFASSPTRVGFKQKKKAKEQEKKRAK